MATNLILLPMCAHMFLVLSLYIVLAMRKAAIARSGKVDLKAAALNNRAWPENVVRVSNNIANQFETPVLFYALTFAIIMVDRVDAVSMGLASAYVVLRFAHAWVHIRSNHVPYRMPLFAASILLLLGMLIYVVSGL